MEFFDVSLTKYFLTGGGGGDYAQGIKIFFLLKTIFEAKR